MDAYKPKYFSPEINAIGSAAYTRTIRPPFNFKDNTGLGYGMPVLYPKIKDVAPSVPLDLTEKKEKKRSSEVTLKDEATYRQSLFSGPQQSWYVSPGVRQNAVEFYGV